MPDLPDQGQFPVAWAALAYARGQLSFNEATRWLIRAGVDRYTAYFYLKCAQQGPRPGFGEHVYRSNDFYPGAQDGRHFGRYARP